jgi:alcohol dehydrogenase class IV
MTDPIGGTEQTEFVDDALPVRVLFGPGRLEQLRTEVDRIGIRRVLVLCTPGHRNLGEQERTAAGRHR